MRKNSFLRQQKPTGFAARRTERRPKSSRGGRWHANNGPSGCDQPRRCDVATTCGSLPAESFSFPLLALFIISDSTPGKHFWGGNIRGCVYSWDPNFSIGVRHKGLRTGHQGHPPIFRQARQLTDQCHHSTKDNDCSQAAWMDWYETGGSRAGDKLLFRTSVRSHSFHYQPAPY